MKMGKICNGRKSSVCGSVHSRKPASFNFDRYNEMSCKQWLLMSVLKAFDTPPDLSTVAKAMGCSRQNVKQLARPLEQEGYIRLENQRKTQGVCAFLILKRQTIQ